MGGLESLLNPCARLDTRLRPGMDLGVRSSLEYECSVTRVAAQSGLVYPMWGVEYEWGECKEGWWVIDMGGWMGVWKGV